MKDPNLCNTPEPCLSIDNIEIWESFSLCTSAAMWSFGRAFSRKSNIGIFFCYFIYQWNLRSRCVPIKQSQFFQCKAVFHPQGPFAHLNKVTTTNWLIIHAASCRAQTRNLQRKGQHSKKGPSIHGYDCLLGYAGLVLYSILIFSSRCFLRISVWPAARPDIPVVPHKAVAEVSKIGKNGWLERPWQNHKWLECGCFTAMRSRCSSICLVVFLSI